jgi:hypothetical protein
MGGIGSGNHGGRPTVEDGLVLDLNRLIRQRIFRPGGWAGSIVWSEVYSGRETARIGYECFMGQESGHVRLRYTVTNSWTNEKHHHDYVVQLVTIPQPFGGRRWWFVCPKRGDLVSKLYKPNGAGRFASQRVYRLAYRSQRQSPYDRALDRAFKLRRRLGSKDGIGDFIEKPKGMRWATFDREMERIETAEAVCNAHLLRFVQKLGRPKRKPSTRP